MKVLTNNMKIKDSDGNWVSYPVLKGDKGDPGDKGDNYEITEGDYENIAEIATENLDNNIKNMIEVLEEEKTYTIPEIKDDITSTDSVWSSEKIVNYISEFDFVKVVDHLPEVGKPNKTYFVTKTESGTSDIYDEYMWINEAWEFIGTKTIDIDLDDYVKKNELPVKDVQVDGSSVIDDNKIANIPTPYDDTEIRSEMAEVTDKTDKMWNFTESSINVSIEKDESVVAIPPEGYEQMQLSGVYGKTTKTDDEVKSVDKLNLSVRGDGESQTRVINFKSKNLVNNMIECGETGGLAYVRSFNVITSPYSNSNYHYGVGSYFKVEKGKTYTINTDIVGRDNIIHLSIFRNLEDAKSSSNNLQYLNNSCPLTITSDYDGYAIFMVRGNSGQSMTWDKVQAELGDTATDYEAYYDKSINGIGTAKDILSVADGTITRKIGVVDLGSLSWLQNGSYGGTPCFYLKFEGVKPQSNDNALCTTYECMTPSNMYTNPNKDMALSLGDGYLRARNFAYDNPTDFKRAMQGVLLYYELAEPVTEPLDMETRIKLMMIGKQDTSKVYTVKDADFIMEYFKTGDSTLKDVLSHYVSDVQVNGESIVEDGVANIPVASASKLGLVKPQGAFRVTANGEMYMGTVYNSYIDNRYQNYALSLDKIDYGVKQAMCDGKGEEWTDAEKEAAQIRLGILSSEGVGF